MCAVVDEVEDGVEEEDEVDEEEGVDNKLFAFGDFGGDEVHDFDERRVVSPPPPDVGSC